jgi:alanine racemase
LEGIKNLLTEIGADATLALAAGQTAGLNEQEQPTARETALQEGLRVWAEIDLDQLTANIHALQKRAGDARLLVVVKANAYGHGAVPVALAAVQAGAWGLGVHSLEEGDELRRAGVIAPIVVLGSSAPAQAAQLVACDLRVTVSSLALGEALSRAAQERGSTVRVHIKVETGMNRFGVRPEEGVKLAEALRQLPGLEVEGLSSHLATADEEDKTFTLQQYKTFQACLEQLAWVPLRHISNTAALLDIDDLRLDLVRPGIGVYGYYPSQFVKREVDIAPVMSLRSRVARVETLEEGAGVGYGLAWRAKRRSRIALVLAGYGDGVRRSLSNRGIALVRGRRAPFAGRVAMDMVMIDVTDIEDVAVDDEVTLIGRQGDEVIDADEVAALAGTVNYEIVTGLMERVPRLYTRKGRIVARQDLTGYRRATSAL